MAGISRSTVWLSRGAEMLLLWISIVVPPSLLQPPLPLSLPVKMSAFPSPWQFLPVSQAEVGPLFSNSSPFSFSQSIFMLPPQSPVPRPGLQASFGPHSVSQPIPESLLSVSPPFSASVISEKIEREKNEGGEEKFRVRALFHRQGNINTQKICVTLHAFKETEEQKAFCITKPPLGLCVATLTLPSDWFNEQHVNQSNQDQNRRYSKIHPSQRVQKRERQWSRHHYGNFVNQQPASAPSLRYRPGTDGDRQLDAPQTFGHLRGRMKNRIQLYYSFINTEADLKLTPAGCVDAGKDQSQRQLFYIKAVTLREQQEDQRREQGSTQTGVCLNGKEEEQLSVDSHVTVCYHKGPVLIGQPVKVSVSVRANFSTQFAVIRLKVRKGLLSIAAQRTLNSDLLAVTLEKSQSSKHDVVSIFLYKHNALKRYLNASLLQQVMCLSVDGLRQSFGVAMTVSAHWWVEYSGNSNPPSPHGTVKSIFSFTDRHIFGIAPITESNTVINTAILSNQPVSLPVIVLAISHDGKMSDVTSAVTCHSTNMDTIKVTSDCSTLFVDGSESGLGSTCAVVEFHLGVLSGSVCLEVWAPSVPLRMSLTDHVLNAIDGWDILTEKGCVPVYQRSSVQILAQFRAKDSHSRTTHLLGSADWYVDVTELLHDWLRVEDPEVASLSPPNIVIGLRPGKTSLHVVSQHWDGVLGRCDVTVSSDAVTPGDLSVQVVGGLGMSVTNNAGHPSIITTTVTAYNILHSHHQEASISVWLQFSDDTASLLSSFTDLPFFLSLSSLAETVVVVTPRPRQQIFAQGDGGGPLLRAELLVSTCADQLVTSNSISEGNSEWGGGGGTRRLAMGSGWIRVNLDLSFLQPLGKTDEESEEFGFDISDTLVESESNVYASHEEESANRSRSSDYYDRITTHKWNKVGNGGMVSQNTLERAVLMPGVKPGTVYFSPSREKEEEEEEEEGVRELGVGVAAVLSLLCLFAVLFLANYLPCTLRDRQKTKQDEESGGKLEGGGATEDEDKRKAQIKDRNNTSEGELQNMQEENIKDDIKERSFAEF